MRIYRQLALLCLAYVVLQTALLLSDPAERHNHEIYAITAAAQEFNRGAIALPDFRAYLNGDIAVPVVLAVAGLLRLTGSPLVTVIVFAGIINLLIVIGWYAVARCCSSAARAFRVACAALLASPSVVLLFSTFDNRHYEAHCFIVITLLLFLRVVRRQHGLLPLVLLAAVLGCGISVTRILCLHVLILAALAFRWLPLSRTLLLLALTVCSAVVFVQLSAYSPHALLAHHEHAVTELAATHALSVTAISRRIVRTFSVALPGSYPGGPVAAGCLLIGSLTAILILLSRSRRPAPPLSIPFFCLSYALLFLLALVTLGLDGDFSAAHAPPWWRFRYLAHCHPLLAILAAWYWPWRTRAGHVVFLAGITVLFLFGSVTSLHFRFRSPSSYPLMNYRVVGENLALAFTPDRHSYWRARLQLLSPEALPGITEGIATTAARPRSSRVAPQWYAGLLPASLQAEYYHALGYWLACFRPETDSAAYAVSLVPAAHRAAFSAGHAAWRSRRDLWPEYRDARQD